MLAAQHTYAGPGDYYTQATTTALAVGQEVLIHGTYGEGWSYGDGVSHGNGWYYVSAVIGGITRYGFVPMSSARKVSVKQIRTYPGSVRCDIIPLTEKTKKYDIQIRRGMG